MKTEKFIQEYNPKDELLERASLRVPNKNHEYVEYEVLDLLSASQENIIYKVRGLDDRTNQLLAIKIRNKLYQHKNPSPEDEHFMNEGQILQQLNHPNIIRLISCSEFSSKEYLTLKYADRGNLYDYIKNNGRLTELESRQIFRQIINGLSYAHSKGICHRDIKAENIFLFDDSNYDCRMRVVIGDWEFAIPFSKEVKKNHHCGSLSYMSPEIWNDEKCYGSELDIWSLGVTLYLMVNGYFPFSGENRNETILFVIKGNYNVSLDWSLALVDLMDGLLKVNSSERLTLEEVKNHVWLSSNESQNLSEYLNLVLSPTDSERSNSYIDSSTANHFSYHWSNNMSSGDSQIIDNFRTNIFPNSLLTQCSSDWPGRSPLRRTLNESSISPYSSYDSCSVSNISNSSSSAGNGPSSASNFFKSPSSCSSNQRSIIDGIPFQNEKDKTIPIKNIRHIDPLPLNKIKRRKTLRSRLSPRNFNIHSKSSSNLSPRSIWRNLVRKIRENKDETPIEGRLPNKLGSNLNS